MARVRWLLAGVLSCGRTPQERPQAPDAPVADPPPALAPGAAPVVRPPEPLPVLAPVFELPAPTRPLGHLKVLHRGENRRRPPPPAILGRGNDWYEEQPPLWLKTRAGYVPADRDGVAILELPDPLPGADIPAALAGFEPRLPLGDDALLMTRGKHGRTFAAVERHGFKVRWQIDGKEIGLAHIDAVGPRTLVVAYYTADADIVVSYALDRGAELWRRGGDSSFTRVHMLWADGERGYMVSDRGLSAFDLVTGDRIWGEVAVGPACAVTVGDDVLAVEDGATQRLFASATGEQVGALKVGDAKACRGDRTVHPETVASPVIAHGRIFAFDPVVGRGKPTLRAVELATGVELWRHRGSRGTVLHALHDEVYVDGRDENTLVALDAPTGETRTQISIGSSFHLGVVPGGGAAGPLVVVHSWSTGTWYLGRAAEPVPLEKWTIRGRLMRPSLVYDRGPIPLAGFAVRVFGREVVTDARGRFTARGQALGLVWIEPGRNRRPARGGRLWWDFWPFFVELDGSGEYAYAAIEVDANYD